jgi:hypothetical protein
MAGTDSTSGKTKYRIVDSVFERLLIHHGGAVQETALVYLRANQRAVKSEYRCLVSANTLKSFKLFSECLHLNRSHLRLGADESLLSRKRSRNVMNCCGKYKQTRPNQIKIKL